jgi:hypothetical protein
MRLIRQQNEIDCGLAVAAMLAGVPYRKAMRADPNPYAERGLSTREMIELLAALTGCAWRASRMQYGRPIIAAKLPPLCAVVIRANAKFGHWIAVKQCSIYDPEMSASARAQDYARGDWRVIRVVSV